MSEVILSPGVFQIESDQSLYTQAPPALGAAIVGPTVSGRPMVPTYVTTYSQYLSLFGDVFKSGSYYYEYFTSLAAKEYFQNGGQSLLVTRIVSGSANLSTYATSNVSASIGNSFTLETLAWGNQMNNSGAEVSGALASGSSSNVRWEVTNANTGSNGGTFTIVVRRGDDNQAQKNILETWANVSLDPQLPNYISRVIGDLKPVYDATNGYVNYTGSFANASQYIRVSAVTTPNVDSIDNNGNFKNTQYSGSLPLVGSGSFSGGVAATNQSQLMNESITATNIQGFSPSDYNTAFTLLSNKDEYSFNVLLAPGVTLGGGTSAGNMIACAEGRGDAIAIVDTGIYGTSITSATSAAAGQSSNYAATYYPWIQLYSSNLGKVVWSPASTVIGGVLAFNDQVGAEWFAPAGLNRGGVPSVVRAERRLQQTDRDTLYTGNVNPLASFPGTGVVVWGQKTLQRKPTSLDRVNVRRLLIALKDYIGGVSRGLVFEQNTTVTRNSFLSKVNPYLESVVSRQGLYAFKVIMDETNNTADVVDRNQLVGQIYIQPTKTAEYIILNFNILPTGAQFPA
jgi:phage tail sheath protein FI